MLLFHSSALQIPWSSYADFSWALSESPNGHVIPLYSRILPYHCLFPSLEKMLFILDFTSPWTLPPQAILGMLLCFTVGLPPTWRLAFLLGGCSLTHLAVHFCFQHSFPIKGGNQTTSRQCWKGGFVSDFLWGLAQCVIPLLACVFQSLSPHPSPPQPINMIWLSFKKLSVDPICTSRHL